MSADVNPLTVVTTRSRRRKRVGILMEVLATSAALLAVVVLAIVVVSVAKKGLPAINADFFTKTPVPFGQTGGGIKNAIIGTLIMTGMATLIAVPVGVLIAIFNTEFASPQIAETVRLSLNVLAGVPTIVIGIFIFGLLVVGSGQSAIAASVGPLDRDGAADRARHRGGAPARAVHPARGRDGARRDPRPHRDHRDPADDRRRDRHRDDRRGRPSRRRDGAAALHLLDLREHVVTDPHQAMASIPLTIFVDSESPSVADQQTAWAAALVLMAGVLIMGIIGRALSLRTRRQIEKAR